MELTGARRMMRKKKSRTKKRKEKKKRRKEESEMRLKDDSELCVDRWIGER